jgi:hydrogenase maturation protease
MVINLSAALLGLGNILLKDEQVGVHVVNTIKERYACSPGIQIVDGGTLGLDLLPLFESVDKVLIVDAMDFGKEPGYIGIIEYNEIAALIFPKVSLHHLGLADLITAANLRGSMPSHLCLIGIQPAAADYTFGLEMSDIVNDNIEKAINLTIDKLKEWNIICVQRIPAA